MAQAAYDRFSPREQTRLRWTIRQAQSGSALELVQYGHGVFSFRFGTARIFIENRPQEIRVMHIMQ
jgi:hypothetical protein